MYLVKRIVDIDMTGMGGWSIDSQYDKWSYVMNRSPNINEAYKTCTYYDLSSTYKHVVVDDKEKDKK